MDLRVILSTGVYALLLAGAGGDPQALQHEGNRPPNQQGGVPA